MAVEGIARELRYGGAATLAAEGKGSARVTERTYRRRYLVKTTSSKDAEAVVLLAPGLPPIGAQFTQGSKFDPEARVTRITPERKASKVWYVDVDYSTNSDDKESPLDRRPVMQFKFQSFRVPVIGQLKQTASGDADKVFEDCMRNTAGQVFDPPPEVDDSRPVLTITRNEQRFNPLLAITFQDAVNKTPWGGAQQRQAKIMGITTSGRKTEKIKDVEYVYYPVTYEIHYKRETWDIRVLNAGKYYLKVAGADKTDPANLVGFTDAQGKETIGLLAEDGTALANGVEPIWIRKRVYKELDFKLLNLPQQFI